MIQIDDAGSGSLVGGTCIGIYRTETSEFSHSLIPLKYYDEIKFDKKMYLKYAKHIVKKTFKKINVSQDEPIQICSGYIFDDVKLWLTKSGYLWSNKKIQGELQNKIEDVFFQYALSLGLPEGFLTYTRYPFHFHRLIKWVYADYENRFNLCKKGWNSWQLYKDQKIVKIPVTLDHSKYYCLKCGSKILPNLPLYKLQFKSNRTWEIYVHTNC